MKRVAIHKYLKNLCSIKKMMSNSMNIPNPKPISTLNSELMPYVIVGDEAFELSENIMRPYGAINLQLSAAESS